MNRKVSIAIGALTGAGLGWFIGAVIVDYIALKKEEEANENYCDYDVEDETPELEEKVLNGNRKTIKKEPRARVKNYAEYFTKHDRPDLARLAAKYNGGEVAEPSVEMDESDESDSFEEEIEVEDDKDPKVITLAEFANAEGYQTLTLNYYDDDVVTDEHDVPIDRPEQLLGDDALVSFGEGSEDEDVVYVRNEAKKAMYEVVRLNKEYSVPGGVSARKSRPTNQKKVEEEEDYGEEDS